MGLVLYDVDHGPQSTLRVYRENHTTRDQIGLQAQNQPPTGLILDYFNLPWLRAINSSKSLHASRMGCLIDFTAGFPMPNAVEKDNTEARETTYLNRRWSAQVFASLECHLRL